MNASNASNDFMDSFLELGFDFDGSDSFTVSIIPQQSDLCPSISNPVSTEASNDVEAKPIVAKSVKRRIGSKSRLPEANRLDSYGKMRTSVCRGNSARSNSGSSFQQSVGVEARAPVVKLHVFPSFDKCDAMVYFPNSLSKHLNTGDMQGLSKLLTSRLEKDCLIAMPFFVPGQINVTYLVKVFEMICELHPDMISCASNTTIQENVIKASIHTKYTECQMIHDAVRGSITDPAFSALKTADRVQELQHELERENRTQEEKDEFLALAASGTDLLVYIHLDLEMVINDLTKKVSKFSLSARLTSMHSIADVTHDEQ